MNISNSRKYTMTTRAESAAQTKEQIIKVIGELWLKYSIHEITLEMIAKKAGVTVRTILRKYGSKERLFEAAVSSDAAGIEEGKDVAEVGNIEQAVSVLMKDYELTGAAVIRTLAVEAELALARKILKRGRVSHKNWCARIFAPYLPKKADKDYQIMLGAFYAATDVYKWKLLRKDLGYSKQETEKIILQTLYGLTNHPNK